MKCLSMLLQEDMILRKNGSKECIAQNIPSIA